MFGLPLKFVSLFLFPKLSIFPTYTQTCLSKKMISDSLTIGSSWTMNMKFRTYFHTQPPLGFLRYYLWWKKCSLHLAFFFPAYFQTRLSKIMISNLLTIGSLWILTSGSKCISSHIHRWKFKVNICECRNTHRMKTVEWRFQSFLLLSNAWKP